MEVLHLRSVQRLVGDEREEFGHDSAERVCILLTPEDGLELKGVGAGVGEEVGESPPLGGALGEGAPDGAVVLPLGNDELVGPTVC